VRCWKYRPVVGYVSEFVQALLGRIEVIGSLVRTVDRSYRVIALKVLCTLVVLPPVKYVAGPAVKVGAIGLWSGELSEDTRITPIHMVNTSVSEVK